MMALCRGQAIDVLTWLGTRAYPFTARFLAEKTELDKRTAERWLRDLKDRGLVRENDGEWVSQINFGVRS